MSEEQVGQAGQEPGGSKSIPTEILEVAEGLRYLAVTMDQDSLGASVLLSSLQQKAESIVDAYEFNTAFPEGRTTRTGTAKRVRLAIRGRGFAPRLFLEWNLGLRGILAYREL